MARVLDDGVNVGGLTQRPRQAQQTSQTLTGAATPEDWLVEQVRGMTVNDVVSAVRAGTLERADALAAERAGKARASLVGALEE